MKEFWNNIAENFPRAYWELITKKGLLTDQYPQLTHYIFSSCSDYPVLTPYPFRDLYDWFDGLRIAVFIKGTPGLVNYYFKIDHIHGMIRDYGGRSRTEAEQAAFTRAFEIGEEQLKDQDNE